VELTSTPLTDNFIILITVVPNAHVEHATAERGIGDRETDGGSRGWCPVSVAKWLPGSLADGGVRAWVPVCLRAVAVALVAPAAALKVVDYGGQASFFAEIGVPAPEITVLVVAAVQLLACTGIAVGVANRLAAFVLVPIMLTAMALYAVVPSNAAVLVASVGVVALGPGAYARWDPDETVFDRFPPGT
jgi:uncharacterized membrane protein YphA (DoxX/SURF4 family)